MSLGVRKDLSCEKVRPSENLVFPRVLRGFRKVKDFAKSAEVLENLLKISSETSSEIGIF